MKLYASRSSPFVRKIRVMLIEKKAPHALEMLNLQEPNDLKTVNPLGKVPALKLDDGRVLTNSPLIADYVDGSFPVPRFIPADPEQRLEVRRWEALADGTLECVTAITYEARYHDEKSRSRPWFEHQRGKVEGGFAALEAMLGERRWCVGEAMTLADIAVACHIGFVTLRRPDLFAPEKHPHLTRLWRDMEARESMRATAPPPA
jgi:glutathione S-transferase